MSKDADGNEILASILSLNLTFLILIQRHFTKETKAHVFTSSFSSFAHLKVGERKKAKLLLTINFYSFYH